MEQMNDLVTRAFSVYEDQRFLHLEETMENRDAICFSLRYRRRKKRLIHFTNRKKVVSRQQFQRKTRAMTALIVTALLMAILTISALGLRAGKEYFQFVREREKTTIRVQNENSIGFAHGTYTYIPEGFSMTGEQNGKDDQCCCFRNKEGQHIYSITWPNNGIQSVATHGEEMKKTAVCGHEGWTVNNGEEQMLIWVDGLYNITLITDAPFQQEELRKMAESRKEESGWNIFWHQRIFESENFQ